MAPHLYCNFLKPDKTERHAFITKPTELAHVHEQVDKLDRHISDLSECRSALLHRSNQLTSPTYILPPEVLSYIFCLTNERERPRGGYWPNHVPQAIILSSVSYQWRQVALSTPKLWERVGCQCTGSLHRNSSLLIQHFASYASSLDISVHNNSERNAVVEPFNATATVLSSSDVTRKLKSLQLLSGPSPDWIPLLPSFLRLENLTIQGDQRCYPSVDLGSLPLSRVYLSGSNFESLTLPPSVRTLSLRGRSADNFALLYNCPRLVEFTSHSSNCVQVRTRFIPSRPLVLDSIKKLAWSPALSFVQVASATGLKIPVIENLELDDSDGLKLDSFTMLCHQISASLETLILGSVPYTNDWPIEHLRHLFKFPIPTLRKLTLTDWPHEYIIRAIRALTPEDGDDGYKERCLPKLEYLFIGCHGPGYEPCDFNSRILDFVKRRKIGEDSLFHLDSSSVYNVFDNQAYWDPKLMEEFWEFVANHRVEVTVEGSPLEVD